MIAKQVMHSENDAGLRMTNEFRDSKEKQQQIL